MASNPVSVRGFEGCHYSLMSGGLLADRTSNQSAHFPTLRGDAAGHRSVALVAALF